MRFILLLLCITVGMAQECDICNYCDSSAGTLEENCFWKTAGMSAQDCVNNPLCLYECGTENACVSKCTEYCNLQETEERSQAFLTKLREQALAASSDMDSINTLMMAGKVQRMAKHNANRLKRNRQMIEALKASSDTSASVDIVDENDVVIGKHRFFRRRKTIAEAKASRVQVSKRQDIVTVNVETHESVELLGAKFDIDATSLTDGKPTIRVSSGRRRLSTTDVTVTVGTYDNQNRYEFNGVLYDTYSTAGVLRFDFSSLPTHPFRLSTTPDGTHGGGVEYTGVDITNGVLTVTLDGTTPTLYFYCENHPGMGGSLIYEPSIEHCFSTDEWCEDNGDGTWNCDIDGSTPVLQGCSLSGDTVTPCSIYEAGRTTAGDTTVNNTCDHCEAGYGYDGGCYICQSGHYNANISDFTQDCAPMQCPIGTGVNHNGEGATESHCSACVDGHYSNSLNGQCLTIAAGYECGQTLNGGCADVQDIDGCDPHPCNDGTCTDIAAPGTGYTCDCPEGFSGSNCEIFNCTNVDTIMYQNYGCCSANTSPVCNCTPCGD